MGLFTCLGCGQRVQASPSQATQKFCSALICQRERKRLWQREKRRSDPDYLENQRRAQAAWAKRNSEYWREYRERVPSPATGNKAGNSEMDTSTPAKMDAHRTLPAGVYRLLGPLVDGESDTPEWIVRLVPLVLTRQS